MNELPLQELFTRLREAGLPLGLAEYRLLLQALQGGFGLRDRAALRQLCQTLWIKSEEEQQLFDYYFDQVMGSKAPEAESTQVQQRLSQKNRWLALGAAFLLGAGLVFGLGEEVENVVPPLKEPPPPETLDAPVASPPPVEEPQDQELGPVFWSLVSLIAIGAGVGLAWGADRLLQRLKKQPPSPTDAPTTSLPQLTQKVADEIQAARAVRQVTSLSEEQDRFLQSAEYFPVTQRQMKRSWRYLNRRVREGICTELDLEATIQQIGQQGILLEPVLVPRRVNRAEIWLLFDQDGSMVPFHPFSQRLIETALRGGRLGQTGIYYFHNCPVEYLYQDPYHQEAQRIDDLLTGMTSNRLGVLIFSDAGAARGGLNPERVDLTVAFLHQLKQKIRYISWLNPLPRSRWLGTTAGEIARFVPMFEVSRAGLDGAIDVLRGRGSQADLRESIEDEARKSTDETRF